MKQRKKNTDALYTSRFMLLSFAALGLLLLCLFVILPLLFGANQPSQTFTPDFYLKENSPDADPLTTVVPRLEDIIAGPVISADDPLLGPPDAPVTITVYSDFTCHYCGQTVALARQVQQNFAKTVRLAHKDFPNPNKAYTSYQAAIAGRCAQRQNVFWELAEQLYASYDDLAPATVTALADELGLDTAAFANCQNGRTAQPVTALIDDNITEANALGIVGVPLVYVNNRELPAELTYEELTAAVERELQQQ